MVFIRKISLFFISMIFISYQAIAVGMLDIDDYSKDFGISPQHLPKFITEIFKTRAEYLKEKKDFQYKKDGDLFLSMKISS